MEEAQRNCLRIVRSDLLTIKKIKTIPNYVDNLNIAIEVANYLNFSNNEPLYYQYQPLMKQLRGIDFLELSAQTRFLDFEYHCYINYIYNSLNDIQPPTICKIMSFPKRND